MTSERKCPCSNPSTTRAKSASDRMASAPPHWPARSSAPRAALDWLRARHADGALPLLRYPEKTDDLTAVRAAGQKLAAGASDIVILGTGGSSLGGQTLAQLAGHGVHRRRRLQLAAPAFHGQSRPHYIRDIAGQIATQDHALCRDLEIRRHRRNLDADHRGAVGAQERRHRAAIDSFFGISEPTKAGKGNGLRDLLGSDVPMLDHDTGVGGRFSVLTNVGLLPAAALGLDIGAIRKGAAAALAPVLAKKPAAEVPAALGAALAMTLAASGKTIAPMFAYADRLANFSKWYVQLWAESLGKNGKGTTPLAALGPVDQHSQLQLFIGGPRDKLFTVVTTDTAGRGPKMDGELSKRAGEAGFGGKTMGDLVAAQGRATAETLAKNGCPVRTIHVPKLDEASLGELLMHFMLETIIAAHLLGIDAFDQPAVEEGKVLAKKYLQG